MVAASGSPGRTIPCPLICRLSLHTHLVLPCSELSLLREDSASQQEELMRTLTLLQARLLLPRIATPPALPCHDGCLSPVRLPASLLGWGGCAACPSLLRAWPCCVPGPAACTEQSLLARRLPTSGRRIFVARRVASPPPPSPRSPLLLLMQCSPATFHGSDVCFLQGCVKQ